MSQTSSSEPDPSAERRSELEKNLAEVRGRIAVACAAAGRDPGEITLIAITKTRPPADVLLLHELGLTDFGENKDQEAAPKAAAVAAALADADAGASASAGAARSQPLRWHFVGQLQTNKASSVAGYADVVHSVDRARLVRALGAAARKAGRELTCLVQVDLDTPADPARGGVPPGQVREIAEAIEAEQNLILGGVMAIAPLGADPARAFAPLRPCSLAVRAVNPAAAIISAGMSGDLEAAIGNGATHVRIGTALLGARRPLVR
ncbi:MAG: YggS family pyridoxal phosphate enzyme [Trebonia sp.]|uniref:YggS family pyridoxal phosphate enzyme n=2 Tax=Trebonia sp. TaxID=2767075 RepID=UPI003BAE7A3B